MAKKKKSESTESSELKALRSDPKASLEESRATKIEQRVEGLASMVKPTLEASPDDLFDDPNITFGESFMAGDTLLINRRPTTPKKSGPPITSPVQFPSPARRGSGIRTNLSSMAPFIEAGGARVPRVLPKDVDRGSRTLNIGDVKKEQEYLGVANVLGSVLEGPAEIVSGKGRGQKREATGAKATPVTVVRQGPSEWAKPRPMVGRRQNVPTDIGVMSLVHEAGGYVIQGASYKNPYAKAGDPDFEERQFNLADPDDVGRLNVKNPRTGKSERLSVIRVGGLTSEGRKLRGPRVKKLGSGSLDKELLIEDIVTRTRSGVRSMMEERPFGNEGRPAAGLVDPGSGVRSRRDLVSRPATEKEKEEGFTTGPKVTTPRGGGTSSEVLMSRVPAAEEARRNRPAPPVPKPTRADRAFNLETGLTGIKSALSVEHSIKMNRIAAMAEQQKAARAGQVMTAGGYRTVPSAEERAEQLEAHKAVSPETVREVMSSSTRGAVSLSFGLEPRTAPRFSRNNPIWQRIAQQEAARRGA